MNIAITPSKICYFIAGILFIVAAVGLAPLTTVGLVFVAAGLFLG